MHCLPCNLAARSDDHAHAIRLYYTPLPLPQAVNVGLAGDVPASAPSLTGKTGTKGTSENKVCDCAPPILWAVTVNCVFCPVGQVFA